MYLFDVNNRYISSGIQQTIPQEMVMLLYATIDAAKNSIDMDYLQIFELSEVYMKGGWHQKIIHRQEEPEYESEIILPINFIDKPVTCKIYVIDSYTYSTMILADEY